MKKQLLALSAVAVFSLSVTTVQASEEDKGPWVGNAGLGFFSSSGNSDTS